MTKHLKTLIYAVAAITAAIGTGEYVLAMHGYGWRGALQAVSAVVCIEALFLWLVAQARAGAISPLWSVAPLVATGVIQCAKVAYTDGAGQTVVLDYGLSVATIVALGCVVYLGELRAQHAETPAQSGATVNVNVLSTGNVGVIPSLTQQDAQGAAQIAAPAAGLIFAVNGLESQNFAPRKCRHCGEPIPDGRNGSYCSDSHRAMASAARRKVQS